MKKFTRLLILAVLWLHLPVAATAQRQFRHPGISWTQADLDRMRAAVAAKQEPYYSTYLKMKADGNNNRSARAAVTQIWEGGYNQTVALDGRVAMQLALLWKIDGNRAYADHAVEMLNAWNTLTNASARGTAPMDAGKIYMLLDAAELMRDYEGWKQEDQEKFRQMLVYPGYSTTRNMRDGHVSMKDEENDVSFYWNILNGDYARWGNQGLFAMRGLMAMGIFLDNDTIYDRAVRKVLSLPHRADDLPYPGGPPTYKNQRDNGYFATWDITYNDKGEDYGYDDEFQYYIFENGQSQELSRDQGHALCGVENAFDVCKMAWNQGDDLFHHDYGLGREDRILKGLEYTFRYNFSFENAQQGYKYFPADSYQAEVFEPTPVRDYGWNTDTISSHFIQRTSRSHRFRQIKPCPYNGGDETTGLTRGGVIWSEATQRYMHYKVRFGLDDYQMLWQKRMYDAMLQDYGYEPGYNSGHHYELNGWGQLLAYRTPWMAGDGGTWTDGRHQSGLPSFKRATSILDLRAADYDYYNDEESGEGHTFHNVGTTRNTVYRTEGTPEVEMDTTEGPVLTQLEDGEWTLYTFIAETAGSYHVSLLYSAEDGNEAAVRVATDGQPETEEGITLPSTGGTFQSLVITEKALPMKAGAQVLRLRIEGQPRGLKIACIYVGLKSKLPETLTGIKSIGQLDNLQSDNVTGEVYDLGGRKLSNCKLSNCQIPKGVLVAEGRKFIR